MSFSGASDKVFGHNEFTCVCSRPDCFTEDAVAEGIYCAMLQVERTCSVYLIQHNSEDDGIREHWLSVSSPNGLADVHWLHVGSQNGSPRIEKDKRDVFVKGRIQDVRKQFQVGGVCCTYTSNCSGTSCS